MLQFSPSRQRIHPDDRERVWEEEQEALRQKTDFAAEFRIVLPDGTVKHLEATAHHVFSSLGALVEAVNSHVDVTERKRAQEEHERLRQLESDLAHMNRLSMMGEQPPEHDGRTSGLAGSRSQAANRRWSQQREGSIEFLGQAAAGPG